MKKKKEAYYVHVYTLRDKSTKSIKIEPWRSLKEEMNVLGLRTVIFFKFKWYGTIQTKMIKRNEVKWNTKSPILFFRCK